MKPSELLDMLKESTGAASDYRAAKILGIQPTSVTKWRHDRSFPDNELCIKIAGLIDVSPAALLIYAAMWRAKDRVEGEIWKETLEHLPEERKLTEGKTGELF